MCVPTGASNETEGLPVVVDPVVARLMVQFKGSATMQVHKDAILFENNKLVNDLQEVCGIFNNFLVNVAKTICENSIPVSENHPSIMKIKENLTQPSFFQFKPMERVE